MTTRKKKPAKKKASGSKPEYLPAVKDQLGTGMPAMDSVKAVVPFESPDGRKFEILRTTERDAYDPPPKPQKKPK